MSLALFFVTILAIGWNEAKNFCNYTNGSGGKEKTQLYLQQYCCSDTSDMKARDLVAEFSLFESERYFYPVKLAVCVFI